ncbi:MAG: M24 family metallopeptidase [Bacillota bacterium]
MHLFTDKLPMIYETLRENGIDLWVIIARETELNSEPVLPGLGDMIFFYGSILAFSKEGKMYASISPIDYSGYVGMEGLDDLECYESLTQGLANIIKKVQPRTIGLNFNENDPASDGLTAGMMIKVRRVLDEIEFSGEVVSAFPVASRVRSHKNAYQLEQITECAYAADQIARDACDYIEPGMSALDLYNFLQQTAFDRGYTMAWLPSQCPAVATSGPKGRMGHIGPSDEDKIEAGCSITIDYGVRKGSYCCDIQRTYYVLKPGEVAPPPELARHFANLRNSIDATAAYMRPGMTGEQVDAFVREKLRSFGYRADFRHGLGHQVGFVAHDGGPVLAPSSIEWYNRYELIGAPIQEGYVFTLEPNLGIRQGLRPALEEMVVVRENGGQFISNCQKEIYLIRSFQ